MPRQITDFSRLCIHTITTKPWSLKIAVKKYAEAGIAGVTVWRQALENVAPANAGQMIRQAGLTAVSLCRGGFFPAKTAEDRKSAVRDNLAAIDEAAGIGAPMVVLVCGAVPGLPLEESRNQIREGIEAILPHAENVKIKLAIEPLHPMYADNRSAINTMKQANEMCRKINSHFLGVAVDVYHVWWDSDLAAEIKACGEIGKIFAFHICDWRTPTEDLLNDRGLMGEGCIPIRKIRGWVEEAGFDGFIEVEIFSNRRWAMDQDVYLKQIKQAYLNYS